MESPLSLAEMCALRGRVYNLKNLLWLLSWRDASLQLNSPTLLLSIAFLLFLTAMCKRIAEPLTCGPTVSFHTRHSPRLNLNVCLSSFNGGWRKRHRIRADCGRQGFQ